MGFPVAAAILHDVGLALGGLNGSVIQEGDSATTKLEGSLINALIFVTAITVVTFILVLLFKYGVRIPSASIPSPAVISIHWQILVHDFPQDIVLEGHSP